MLSDADIYRLDELCEFDLSLDELCEFDLSISTAIELNRIYYPCDSSNQEDFEEINVKCRAAKQIAKRDI